MELTLIDALGKLGERQYNNSLDGLRNLASQFSVKVLGAASGFELCGLAPFE